MPHEVLSPVVERLATAPSVAAIVLVGSHARMLTDAQSDFDLFVYADSPLATLRSEVAAEFADEDESQSLHERAFGDTDVWRLTGDGSWLDLMYWATDWAESQLQRVLASHEASMGYSTAFWRSIREAMPLYERDAWHSQLQRHARQDYPEELRRNIVRLNYPYLRDHPFSYRSQAAKALHRDDRVSVNHRTASWLASYFDILFAANRVLHPGEKRMLEAVQRECRSVPEGMERAVDELLALAGQASTALLDGMDELTDGLEHVLRRESLIGR